MGVEYVGVLWIYSCERYIDYLKAWCSKASNRRFVLSAPTISGCPLITSLRRQLSMIGNLTSFSSDRQTFSWLSISAGQCSNHRAAASNNRASSQSTMSSEPKTTLGHLVAVIYYE